MLKAEKLTKSYGDTLAVNGLNLSVGQGDVFCLLGPNGAGKTTTVNMFMNFISPDSGAAWVNGIKVSERPDETKRYLAYIPENLVLYPNLTGLENLAFFSHLSNGELTNEELHGLLDAAGLQEEAQQRRVREYSKGMRQKVGIAIALAKEAKALILDEPTSGLDPKASNEFAELLQKLSANGVAIMMTTHDLFRAKETGTHVGIMRNGELVETMTTEEINHTDLEKLYLEHMHG